MAKTRALGGVLAVVLWAAAVPTAAAFKNVEEGQKAPEFRLRSTAGEPVRLSEAKGHRGLIIGFWALWSPRSRTMLDDLSALQLERGRDGLAVLGVNVEHEHLSEAEEASIREMAATLPFPTLLDEGLGVYAAYGVVATPSLALVDAQGIVRYTRAGFSSSAPEDLRDAVDALLGAGPAREGRPRVELRDYVPPVKATLHHQKGLMLLRRGMTRRAAEDFEQAAVLDPEWAAPRFELARLLRAEGNGQLRDLEKAEAFARAAARLRPQRVQRLVFLSDFLIERGKLDEALSVAEQALSLEPGFTPALVVKARGLRGIGRAAEAEAVLAEAIGLDPRNAGVHRERGEAAAAAGDWKQAAESLRTAAGLMLGERP